ncbi:MAG: hypothetical protein A9Z00_09220 [Thermobacillus sp. ZCTH02-B1]|nr:MAG: hypothetical protein A9Z00_09220 [Thermobacillus sp. ZCTH02-B1]
MRHPDPQSGQRGRTDGTKAGKRVSLNGTGDPELDPFEINFLPEFRVGRGPRGPFVNEHGVVIGDHEYASPNSPLENWSKDTDPAVMSGDQWVHPFKDIGFRTAENRMLFEEGIPPQAGIFMHPDKDAAYKAFRTDDPAGGRSQPEKERPE